MGRGAPMFHVKPSTGSIPSELFVEWGEHVGTVVGVSTCLSRGPERLARPDVSRETSVWASPCPLSERSANPAPARGGCNQDNPRMWELSAL